MYELLIATSAMFATILGNLIIAKTLILATTISTLAIVIESSIKKKHRCLILNSKKQN